MRTLNQQRAFDKKLQQDDFVLIYQMGKVGSSSVEASLEKIDVPNWHLHSFDDNEEFLIYKNTDDVNCFFDWHIRGAYKILLGHRLRILQKRDYLKIITLVRDPIATVVSRFFNDIHIQFIEAKKNGSIHGSLKDTMEYLVEAFETQIDFEFFTHWYDRELQKNFDIDIFSYIHSPNQDFWRIEQSGRDVLLVKCEALKDISSELGHFLEVPIFNLINCNIGENKWYSELYQHFLKIYSFEKLFFLYDTPLYKTLYSSKEIKQFKAKWKSKNGSKG